MASHEDYYTSQSSPRPLSQAQFQTFPHQAHAETPPPPPPKPMSQEPSRIGTPQNTGPAPPLPPLHAFSGVPQSPTSNSPRPQPPVPSTQDSQYHTSTLMSNPQNNQQQPAYYSPLPPPSLSETWLPSAPPVSSFSTTELAPVLSNPALLLALASTHPSHQSSLQPLSAVLEANIALAQRVSQLESHISKLRSQTQQLLLQHTTLSTQWRRKQSEMDDALSPWGPRAMYQRLVSSINEQESLVRAMQESFLEGEGEAGYSGASSGGGSGKASEKEVSEWIRRIREGTTTLEKRREMRTRWDEGRVGGWR